MPTKKRTRRRYTANARLLLETENELARAMKRMRKLADILDTAERDLDAIRTWAKAHGYEVI